MSEIFSQEIPAAAGDGGEGEKDRDYALFRGGEGTAEGRVEPRGEREANKECGEPHHALNSALAAKNREDPDEGGEKGKRHELLETLHPRAGAGEKFHPAGLGAEKQVGKRHAERDGGEHRENDGGALAEGKSERTSEKRGGAGRGEQGGENALKKWPAEPSTRSGRFHRGGGSAGKDELEHAGEVQGEDKNDRADGDVEPGVLELECPGDFGAAGFKSDDDRGESEEPREDAGGEGESMRKDRGARVAGLLDEAENFQRDHRQDARHEVQDQSSEEAVKKREPEAHRRGGGLFCLGGILGNEPSASAWAFAD